MYSIITDWSILLPKHVPTYIINDTFNIIPDVSIITDAYLYVLVYYHRIIHIYFDRHIPPIITDMSLITDTNPLLSPICLLYYHRHKPPIITDMSIFTDTYPYYHRYVYYHRHKPPVITDMSIITDTNPLLSPICHLSPTHPS